MATAHRAHRQRSVPLAAVAGAIATCSRGPLRVGGARGNKHTSHLPPDRNTDSKRKRCPCTTPHRAEGVWGRQDEMKARKGNGASVYWPTLDELRVEEAWPGREEEAFWAAREVEVGPWSCEGVGCGSPDPPPVRTVTVMATSKMVRAAHAIGRSRSHTRRSQSARGQFSRARLAAREQGDAAERAD